ncbi:MAG TPA: glutathione synthase [Verrucomicrobiae bacterium]|jgi:glutathione synthase|nr:glutathione synthase [Verrucomicrobiae bacterium]
MKTLFVLDPLSKLMPEYDSSLHLLAELGRRGHKTWAADVPDLWENTGDVFARCRPVRQVSPLHYRQGPAAARRLRDFDLVLVRKEPPFDSRYLAMTYLLERAARHVFISNDPRGIRNNNEKLCCFQFPRWMPRTLVASDAGTILAFRRQLRKDVVIKPLDLKGGEGIFILPGAARQASRALEKATKKGSRVILAQEFLETKTPGDKRIFILEGKFLAAYERRPKPGEFRSNLGQGGSFHAVELTAREKQMVREMGPFLRKEGLHFVGIDVMQEKLLEINVTCPGGYPEAIRLYPKKLLLEAWADWLERRARNHRR